MCLHRAFQNVLYLFRLFGDGRVPFEMFALIVYSSSAMSQSDFTALLVDLTLVVEPVIDDVQISRMVRHQLAGIIVIAHLQNPPVDPRSGNRHIAEAVGVVSDRDTVCRGDSRRGGDILAIQPQGKRALGTQTQRNGFPHIQNGPDFSVVGSP